MIAIQRQKNSHQFYNLMAGLAASQSAQNLFHFLAQEKLEHKNKEALYHNTTYKQS